MNKENLKWYERKRLWCRLPWTFTKYGMSEDRIFVETGLFNTVEYEVRLYRVINVSLKKSFIQKLFGLGTIHIDSNDKDLKCFDLINIPNCDNVKENISNKVEEERKRNRVTSREYMSSDDNHEEDLVEEIENNEDDE